MTSSDTGPLNWADRVRNLGAALGREPTIAEIIDAAQGHVMTPAEVEEQRQSLARGLSARCEHGEIDFEQCPKCRGWDE